MFSLDLRSTRSTSLTSWAAESRTALTPRTSSTSQSRKATSWCVSPSFQSSIPARVSLTPPQPRSAASPALSQHRRAAAFLAPQLLATDGVWDNIFDDEICRIADQELSRGGSPQAAAERVASAAQMRGADTKSMTPFAVSAMKNRLQYRGGKPDDVTVLVAIVSECGAPGGGGKKAAEPVAAASRSKL